MRDSLIVFVFFAVGVALGYADAVPTWLLDPDLPMIILSVMVVLVSLGLGAGDNLHYMLRTFNWRMLLLPLCTIVGTLLFSALGVLVLRGFSLTDCLAVGSGFGYYSLSSVLIADLKSATLGVQGAAELATVALLANVVREMIALFGMPLFARWGGPLAPISVSGVTSMDVCLPSIARYSGSAWCRWPSCTASYWRCVCRFWSVPFADRRNRKKESTESSFLSTSFRLERIPCRGSFGCKQIFRQNGVRGVLICRPVCLFLKVEIHVTNG